MIRIPSNFHGEKFREKFKLSNDDFYAVGKKDENGKKIYYLIVKSMPELTEDDLRDCVAMPDDDYEEITINDFLDAFIEYDDGKKEKMKTLFKRYDKKKEKKERKDER